MCRVKSVALTVKHEAPNSVVSKLNIQRENDSVFDLFCDAGFERPKAFYASQTSHSIEPKTTADALILHP